MKLLLNTLTKILPVALVMLAGTSYAQSSQASIEEMKAKIEQNLDNPKFDVESAQAELNAMEAEMGMEQTQYEVTVTEAPAGSGNAATFTDANPTNNEAGSGTNTELEALIEAYQKEIDDHVISNPAYAAEMRVKLNELKQQLEQQ